MNHRNKLPLEVKRARPPRLSCQLKQLLWAGFACLQVGLAQGACSRTISVPAAPTGFSVITAGDKVSGVYPDVLRESGPSSACSFSFPVVPRARLDRMFFETGEADILIPSSRTTERDQKASFVPLIQITPALVSLKSKSLPVKSVSQLIEAVGLRGAVVCGYTYGDEYQALLLALDAKKRIDYVSDLSTVARMLAAGRVDFTIVAPTLMYAAVVDGSQPAEFKDKFDFVPLEGLQRIESGAYLSGRSLTEADQEVLRTLLLDAARDGTFERYYPPELLRGVVSRR